MAPSRGLKRTAGGSVKGHAYGDRSPHPGTNRTAKIVNFADDGPSPIDASKVSSPNLRQRSKELLSVRQQLPIWKHAEAIRHLLRSHDVLLLMGETGSGKSTQIPQFIVTEPWCRRKQLKDGTSVGGCIAITEPRRVAAISLARRVAEEMGTPLGDTSPASQVGYSVRFDNSTGPSTKIKFMTEGMLLQEMLRDPWLKEYSAVVVDEVHERSMNVDLVLGFLRRMQARSRKNDERGGNKIKVAVMSATADMHKVNLFFDPQQSLLNGIGATNGQRQEDEWNGFSDGEDEKPSIQPLEPLANGNQSSMVGSLFIKGRQHPVTIHYSPSPIADLLDAALQRIIDIHTHAPLPGDILIFLTGQETVESLLSLTESYSTSIRKDPHLSTTLPSLLILPLYAALPAHLQQRVFQPTPKFTRKVIFATNIAETSITVSGIRHIIDTGKHKRRLFRPSLNIDSLLTAPISRSSANQRSGRAGRDAPGHAYRLYTEKAFYSLTADTEPEILRCDLSQLVLILKSHGVDDLTAFPLLTPPPRRALERAIMHLLQLSALSHTSGAITPLGREMSLLPLPSHLARILLSSSLPQYNCVDEIIDIVSALSVENVFLTIHSHSQQTHRSDDDDDSPSDPRLTLRSRLHRREGDHLTLLATVQAYVSENTDRKRWCEERGISHRAMQAVMDVRKQLTSLMKRRAGAGAGTASHDTNSTATDPPSKNDTGSETEKDLTTRILLTLLTGLHPNVARLSSSSTSVTATTTSSSSTNLSSSTGPPAQYLTLSTNQPVSIHPSSVLFARKVEAIMSSEYVFTTKPYARCVSAVELGWVRDVVSGNK